MESLRISQSGVCKDTGVMPPRPDGEVQVKTEPRAWTTCPTQQSWSLMMVIWTLETRLPVWVWRGLITQITPHERIGFFFLCVKKKKCSFYKQAIKNVEKAAASLRCLKWGLLKLDALDHDESVLYPVVF